MQRFALNRIACPSLGLEEFFSLAGRLGIAKVELRNDLPGGKVTDGMSPSQAAALAEKCGVRVITINALQKFDLAAGRPARIRELEALLDLAVEIRCPALILCPTNDKKDARDPAARMRETVEALKAYGPAFASRGMLGYVEPLGFGECAVQSLLKAVEAIGQSGFACYRTVHDTFHHYLGPDTEKDLQKVAPLMGLIHASGVEADIPKAAFLDEHRLLCGPKDRMASRDQVRRLLSLGYAGDIALEPFSSQVQKMAPDALAKAIGDSIAYLRA